MADYKVIDSFLIDCLIHANGISMEGFAYWKFYLLCYY